MTLSTLSFLPLFPVSFSPFVSSVDEAGSSDKGCSLAFVLLVLRFTTSGFSKFEISVSPISVFSPTDFFAKLFISPDGSSEIEDA